MTLEVSTPVGDFSVAVMPGSTTVTGVAAATLPSPMNLSTLKRGVVATVEGEPVTVVRPRFGVCRRSRDLRADGAGISLASQYSRDRQYEICRPDGVVVLRRRGRDLFIDARATAPEVAIALALDLSGAIATSSLLNTLTTP